MSHALSPQRTRYVDPQRALRRLRAGDAVVLFLATMALFLGSSLWIPSQAIPLVGFLALEVAVGGVLIMGWLGLYSRAVLLDPRRGIVRSLATTTALGTIVFATTHFGVFALQPAWLVGWLVAGIVHFAITRSWAALWARRKAAARAFQRRVAVVGTGQPAAEAVRLLEGSDELDVNVAGVFDDRPLAAVGSEAKRATLDDLARQAAEGRFDMIIVAIALSEDARLLKALQRLWPLRVDIRISGQVSQLKLSPGAYGYIGKLPLLSVFDRSLAARFRCKDILDRLAAAVLLVLASPVMALAAIAIAIESRGPVLIKQQRYGFNRQAIPVWSLRCTRDGSDAGARLTGDHDSLAYSRVGRCLRAAKLDGLPQLVNVIRGDLSLVGPRPRATGSQAAAALYHQVIDGYFARHGVKPGLTGWAQINDWRGRTWTREAIENRVKHDLEYVDRWSLVFDLYILLKTPFALLRGADAGSS